MFVAISRNDIALVKKILGEGFSPNAIIAVRYGDQPLHAAAYYGRYQIAEMLLARGAAVNALMTGGNVRTPLLNAIWKKHNDVAILLLKNGADPTIKTMAGATPCEFAKRIGNMEILPHLPNCKQ
jgi:ankyrin repeat protein